ncbi:hypothetical protein [Streptomyces sp. 4N124]|uniref:hypothetical protein n=1 Tax=Streptomyces sp. 4N124 TaxID=3457420 RepID=UPI003FD5566D
MRARPRDRVINVPGRRVQKFLADPGSSPALKRLHVQHVTEDELVTVYERTRREVRSFRMITGAAHGR